VPGARRGRAGYAAIRREIPETAVALHTPRGSLAMQTPFPTKPHKAGAILSQIQLRGSDAFPPPLFPARVAPACSSSPPVAHYEGDSESKARRSRVDSQTPLRS